MTITSVESFRAALHESRLLHEKQWDELASNWLPRYRDPHALARQLRVLGWLTPYQIDSLFQGRAKRLVLGHYTLLERLGEGGTAQVFKARHQGLNRIVALKILRAELASDLECVRRFKREVRAISQLAHPNIVHAYDAEEVGDILFYVMEFCEGIDLDRFVERVGPLPVEDACDYTCQAALGLAHAHEHGQVHRDIKPANLLLTTGGALVKILDMGLVSLRTAAASVARSVLTQEWAMLGTPDYVAPEQIINARTVDHRADLYGLGCTLYFLLTGQPPFYQATMQEKLIMHRCLEPEPIERIRAEIPAAVVQIVRRLMAKRPDDRYQDAGEVADALEELDESPCTSLSGEQSCQSA